MGAASVRSFAFLVPSPRSKGQGSHPGFKGKRQSQVHSRNVRRQAPVNSHLRSTE